MARRVISAIAVALCAIFAGSIAIAEAPSALQPLAFLVGEWQASPSAGSGGSAGTAVFSRGLQDRVILRTSFAEYPAAEGKPPSRHDDLMIIYAAADRGVRADYFDNEGHVIRYAVSSPAAGEAVFVSDATGAEPRYRLSYKLDPRGVLKGEFAIASPGQSDAFRTYLTWQSRKAK